MDGTRTHTLIVPAVGGVHVLSITFVSSAVRKMVIIIVIVVFMVAILLVIIIFITIMLLLYNRSYRYILCYHYQFPRYQDYSVMMITLSVPSSLLSFS